MTAALHPLHGQEVKTIDDEAPDESTQSRNEHVDTAAESWRLKVEQLAIKREQRFEARRARIEADTRLDPRLRELFLDRTLWGVADQIRFLNVTDRARISALTGNRSIYHSYDREFPSVLPSPDAPLGKNEWAPKWAIEAGRLRQWAFDDHRVIFDPVSGQLVTNPIWRAGRRPKPRGPNFTSRSGGVDVRRSWRGVPKGEHIAQAKASRAAAKAADQEPPKPKRKNRKKTDES